MAVPYGHTCPFYCPNGIIVIQEENPQCSSNLMGYAMKTKLLIIILVMLVALSWGCARQSIREEDKPLLITVEDLVPYGVRLDDYQQYETFQRDAFVDGSVDIAYEFDPPEDSEINLYLSVTVSFERTTKDAKMAYLMELKGTTFGAKLGGAAATESKGFFVYGDESFFAFLMGEKGPGGNLFITRTGTKVYIVIIGGVYFDNPDDWADVIIPKLQYLESYTP